MFNLKFHVLNLGFSELNVSFVRTASIGYVFSINYGLTCLFGVGFIMLLQATMTNVLCSLQQSIYKKTYDRYSLESDESARII